MNRRTLLTTIGSAATIATCGCLEYATGDGTTRIADYEFETDVDVPEDISLTDGPTIRYGNGEVQAVGYYELGSCYNRKFHEPTYDEEQDELKVELSREHTGGEMCPDEFNGIRYRVTIDFEGSPPGTTIVTERKGGRSEKEYDGFW